VAVYVASWKDHPNYAAIVAADARQAVALIAAWESDNPAVMERWRRAENWDGRFRATLLRIFSDDDADPDEVGQFVIDRSRAEVAIFGNEEDEDEDEEDNEAPAKSSNDKGAA
jgi:hypothetical protein